MKMTFEENVRAETVRTVAEHMLVAARSAPKARGIDNLSIALVDKEGIQEISDKLKEMANRAETMAHLMRDANNILLADKLVLIGTRLKSIGLRSCNMCGFQNCDERDKHPEVPCVFNPGDLGIAIGSAVSVAVDARVDNRIMYSVGQAALEMKLLGKDVKIAFGIPLSVSAKNPFFDRK